MKENKAKAKLASGEPVFYCMTLSHAAPVVEVLGRAGIDLMVIDGEHGPLDRQTLENMVRAAECVGVTPVFRTDFGYPADILPFLDTGVMGVLRPHCYSVERAKATVDAVKYAPLGMRGMTPGRANAYAVSGMSSKDYIGASNRETMVLVQIEDVEGVKNMPEILKVEGIDVFFISSGDLSNSLGYPGQRSHPKVLETIEHCIDLAHAAGKLTNNHAPDTETRKRWFDKGARLIGVGDLRLLYDGTVTRLQALRESVR